MSQQPLVQISDAKFIRNRISRFRDETGGPVDTTSSLLVHFIEAHRTRVSVSGITWWCLSEGLGSVTGWRILDVWRDCMQYRTVSNTLPATWLPINRGRSQRRGCYCFYARRNTHAKIHSTSLGMCFMLQFKLKNRFHAEQFLHTWAIP
jgi:hypothetical protein